ncbi:hypothetical protein LOTGIDRAFT_237713 [Lottia gigantea]|uniref:Uncharacterized protein n=1 Tax=Lottia gigantea TaxID=225164 RepID=V4BBI2_LOTGI|nr:hypothetical protein LOTGIDRAFT_237713 [Lottia gigantea]ESP03407.1 hypothetical protein LOTGIDRAFT_237713 [Lottia gigantea]
MADDLLNIYFEAEKLEKCGENGEALGLYTRFIDSITKTVNSGPKNLTDNERKHLALAYNNRGFLRYLTVDFDGAIEDYTHGLNFDPKIYFSYYNRGLIHYRLGRYKEAIEDMESCLELKADFESAQKCLKQSVIDFNRIKEKGTS